MNSTPIHEYNIFSIMIKYLLIISFNNINDGTEDIKLYSPRLNW